MVDATDLKSVEGQPSWGFESPRRHIALLELTHQNTHLTELTKAMSGRIQILTEEVHNHILAQ